MTAEAHPLLSFDAYVAGQVDAATRLEYVNGRVYVMAGASEQHDLCVSQVVRRFFGAESRGCRVFDHNRKVRTRLRDATYYPDVMVVCGPAANTYYEDDAVVIAEVMSPSTRDIDRREKALAYSTLPSLQMYLLVDLEVGQIDVSVPGEVGWRSHGEGDVIFTPAGDLDVSAVFGAVRALS